MATTKLELGAPLETLTKGEVNEALACQTQEYFRQYARGIKYLRFGPVSGTVSGGAIHISGASSNGLGPREGFVWSIRRITVTGLTTGATPDIVNLYRSNDSAPPVWQFNGNNFIYTFGKTEILLLQGEHLILNGTGLTATGQITISGDYNEVAAEEVYKLL